ncbi:PQQ-dependent sugar dehydrogenase [Lacrimispora brassicae]
MNFATINYQQKLYMHQVPYKQRELDPNRISVPMGYEIEVFAQGLNAPIGMVFTENGDMLIADSGIATMNPRVMRISNGNIAVVADGFNVPLTGINYKNGYIYVSHKGVVTVINPDGTREDIINGLPSYGDFSNNRVEFSNDEKIYFGQGTATNSGVVGLDNIWVFDHPYFHDFPGSYIILNHTNYETENVLIPAMEPAVTGAFSPFGVPNIQEFQVKEGRLLASGSVLRANMDGSDIELVAWGLRNPFCMKFDGLNRLIISNQGMDTRGSRPIANAFDELYLFNTGAWYGWPDYSGGSPITMPRFTPIRGRKPELLLNTIPSFPPTPIAVFPSGSNIMGFDFNKTPDFGLLGDIYIACFGGIQYEESSEYIRSGVGHRILRVNIVNGDILTFAINKSGFPEERGLSRPTDVAFGPDNAMYISDMAIADLDMPNVYLPNTGVIWRIRKTMM